jgi:hypothetical protein
VIDEVGYLSYSNRHADLMFELISRRYQNRSTLVTTNRPFAEWREVFPNAACVVSLVDRLVHNAEIIAVEGDSYRLKEARRPALTSAAGNQVMSNAPEPLPAHLRPVSVGIPVTWTPEQAFAVYELLDDLRERIWELYNLQLQDLLREQQQSPDPDDSDDTLPPTQSAPFI